MKINPSLFEYSAKQNYQNNSSACNYEKRDFYKGILGWYRKKKEIKVISDLIRQIPSNIVILDCPCGNGRWFNYLKNKASRIIALDVSSSMLKNAASRVTQARLSLVNAVLSDAESIPLRDNAVDFTFSFALMKHLPTPVKYRVLMEFVRVSRRGIICSFAIFNQLTYAFWRYKKYRESYPVFWNEIEWMCSFAGLKVKKVKKIATAVGLEHLILFEKEVLV